MENDFVPGFYLDDSTIALSGVPSTEGDNLS